MTFSRLPPVKPAVVSATSPSYRRSMTHALTQNATDYLTKKGYSVHVEIGVCKRGRRRADVLGMTTKNEIIIVEVKSCAADWKTDKKWKDYLPFCNKFYFCVDDDFYSSAAGQEMVAEAKEHGAGVMVAKLTSTRHLFPVACKHNAQRRVVNKDTLFSLVTRMAWRGGHFKWRKPLAELEWENINGIWYQHVDKL
jgi:hypothetical protein